jgi:hypothetical protein
MVMEYLDGESLADRLAPEGRRSAGSRNRAHLAASPAWHAGCSARDA